MYCYYVYVAVAQKILNSPSDVSCKSGFHILLCLSWQANPKRILWRVALFRYYPVLRITHARQKHDNKIAVKGPQAGVVQTTLTIRRREQGHMQECLYEPFIQAKGLRIQTNILLFCLYCSSNVRICFLFSAEWEQYLLCFSTALLNMEYWQLECTCFALRY